MLLVHARTAEQRVERMHRIGHVVLPVIVLTGFAWVALSGARWAGRRLFSENDLFAIQHFELRSDGRLSPDHIRMYAKLDGRENLFAVDIASVRRNLESVPLVRDVTVARRLPDTLIVQVGERVPVARVKPAGTFLDLAVDRDGVIMGPAPRQAVVPLVSGLKQTGVRPGLRLEDPAALGALQFIDLCENTRFCQYVRVREVAVTGHDFLAVTLADGEQVRMPLARMEAKLKKLAAILKTIRDGRMAPDPSKVAIDMTTEANFPVAGTQR